MPDFDVAFSFLGAGDFFTGFTAAFLFVVRTADFVGFFAVLAGATGFFATGFAADFFGAVFDATLSAPDLLLRSKRYNLPTTAFLDIPSLLPISDVDSPLPIKDFSFFSVALSQPLLILKILVIIYICQCSIISNRKARRKNMFSTIFFIILVVASVIFSALISVADFRRRIIPDVYLWPLMLSGLIIVAWFPWICTFRDAAAGAAIGYALAYLVGWLFEKIRHSQNDAYPPIGMGDIKLIAVGGLWLGLTNIGYALILACILGGVWGALRHRRYIPFAPFFIIGGFLTLITNLILL